ncbi:MAG: nuclear transport factor 2 family protein [Bacteroidales bacterium]|nr:nuclear transport factor 2 family protein [Bacteroidales bacterium]
MKKIVVVLFSILVFWGCNEPKKISEQEISAIKDKVDTLLTNWHKAAADADFENYFGVIDSVSVIIGTDASEYWTKKQFAIFCKPEFDEGKAWDFKTIERNVYVSNTADVVWFNELLDTWMGPCRGSGVMAKINDDWKIKQYIFSVTIPNEDILEVIKVKFKSDSVLMSKFNTSKIK